jgi:prepilin-type N-terminal cleavage/methylation domain-containing protein
MKLQASNHRKAQAFTLIEMIGVLAVIAILAALLVPKVFSAINDARVNNACVSIETIKTAVADHYGKYGRLDACFGTNAVSMGTNYCSAVLLPEALIDKPFNVKIGTPDSPTTQVQIVNGGGAVGSSGGYSLDGTSGVSTGTGTMVVEAVISGVAAQDAHDLDTRIDGAALGNSAGRVQYATNSFPTTLYVYITHR